MQRVMHAARLARRPGAPPFDELVELASARPETPPSSGWTRRRFLKTSSAAAAFTLAGGGGLLTSCARMEGAPRIAVIGAGLAGLNAAYTLKKAGLRAEVYEAAKRAGGRVYSVKDVIAPGLVTELGASFFDPGHEDMLSLVEEFGLTKLDLLSPSETELQTAFYFDGKRYTDAQVAEAFRQIAERVEEDVETHREAGRLSWEGETEKANAMRAPLDELTAAEYLDRVGLARAWPRSAFEAILVAEFGLDFEQMSALNFLSGLAYSTYDGDAFALWGEDYARYTLLEGCQAVVQGLADRVEGQINFGHRLEAVTSKGDGFVLTFEGPSASAVDVKADIAIVTVPFSVLRGVDLRVEMPPLKRKVIDELGYGMNPKIQMGFNKRVWREKGYGGDGYSDQPFCGMWDDSQMRPGEAGCITIYPGGQRALDLGEGTVPEQVERLMPGIEKTIPGISAEYNGRAERFHWPTYPFSLGSYTCYLPGQRTTIAGWQVTPVGNLLFAGEHCNKGYKGLLESAVRSGRQVAEDLATRLGKSVPPAEAEEDAPPAEAEEDASG
jgi:monoamine oxidase